MKKNKVKFYRCRHLKSEYDDWGKYAWCQCDSCPTRECWCDDIFQMAVCPCFRSDEEHFVEKETKKDLKMVSEIQNEFKKKLNEKLNNLLDESTRESHRLAKMALSTLSCIRTLNSN